MTFLKKLGTTSLETLKPNLMIQFQLLKTQELTNINMNLEMKKINSIQHHLIFFV